MIHLTAHAIERYQERVKPHLTFEEAEAEARRLLEDIAAITTEPPSWFFDTGDQPEHDGFAMVGDGIAFLLRHHIAITCLTCAGLSEEARFARNSARRGRQRYRNARRMKWKDRRETIADRADRPRRKDWDAAA